MYTIINKPLFWVLLWPTIVGQLACAFFCWCTFRMEIAGLNPIAPVNQHFSSYYFITGFIISSQERQNFITDQAILASRCFVAIAIPVDLFDRNKTVGIAGRPATLGKWRKDCARWLMSNAKRSMIAWAMKITDQLNERTIDHLKEKTTDHLSEITDNLKEKITCNLKEKITCHL